jgi:hypothetical protein
VLRGSSGISALLIIEEKFKGKRARGRPRKMWIDDIYKRTSKRIYVEVKRVAIDRAAWRRLKHQPSYQEDGTN